MSAKIDPITRSVVQHRLSSIVKEMGEAMLRTSYSQILNSSRDFSLAICDTNGRLIAQADHLPVHVGALPWAMLAVEGAIKARGAAYQHYLAAHMYAIDMGSHWEVTVSNPGKRDSDTELVFTVEKGTQRIVCTYGVN